VPTSNDRQRWDCRNCIEYGRNKVRNCGGKYPENSFSYELTSGFTVPECPKTFIKRSSEETIRVLETLKRFPSTPILDLPNKLADFLILYDEELQSVEAALADYRAVQQKQKDLLKR
jgi:hypothetical protein